MRWALTGMAPVLALALGGCPTASTPDAGRPREDVVISDALPVRDAEPRDAAPADVGVEDGSLADAEPGDALDPLDADRPDTAPTDGGFVLQRGALRPGVVEARSDTVVLRGHLGVSTATRARTRTHSLEGGLGPLGY